MTGIRLWQLKFLVLSAISRCIKKRALKLRPDLLLQLGAD
jgi:hypothetical protein